MVSDYRVTLKEVADLYLADKRPWIIGFSGGKDSTCVTQLVYNVLLDLPPEKRHKEVHVLSSDTLVESPAIQTRIVRACGQIAKQAKTDGLPIRVKIIRPTLEDSFWVNLIGRGYPSPNKWFRWCTERLKINPMNRYIVEQVKSNGEVIILLGARKAESASRAQVMAKYKIKDLRLRTHSDVLGAYVYAPLEDWEVTDVWTYLIQAGSPWGANNKELLKLYRTSDRECPMVIDKLTPACGGSRFGCWTCTVVDRDRALEGMIEDGETWLKPLLEFRDWLKKIRDDEECREPIRKNERMKQRTAQFYGREFEGTERHGHRVLGPFKFEVRHQILTRLMGLHKEFAPKGFPLISPEEIKAIETVWVYEGDHIGSIADVLDATSKPGVKARSKEGTRSLDMACSQHGLEPDMVRRLLLVENDLTALSRRKTLYDRLERVLGEAVFEETPKGVGLKK
jgi:DNA sulfur modification protein DndC